MAKYSKLLISLILGILAGIALLFILYLLPLPVNNPLYKTFGIYKPQVVGFLPFWLLERADKNYSPYITTLSYFGLSLDNDGTVVQLENKNEEEPGWHGLRSDNLKNKLQESTKNHLTNSLLVRAMDEATISALISNPKEHAQNLIKDVIPQMKKYHYTDLNLDIEGFKESSPSARENFTQFVREIKKGLDEQNLGTTLTIDISPSALIHPYLIDPLEIGKIVDFVVFMTYDYHNLSSPITGPVSPLGGSGTIREIDVFFSLKQVLTVIPAKKLLLGIPLYGYEWETLTDKPNSPTIPGTGQTASSRRIAKILTDCKNCQTGIDELGEQPYIIFPDEKDPTFHQIYFEDQNSLKKKVELAKKYKLAGVALWALGYEDEKLLEPLRGY